MGVLIEINSGPMAGKKIAIVTGQTVTFGRAAGRAQFALPHDTFMSGVHFAVECGTSGYRVVDRKSSNGTFLNGAKIQDAMLANGDEIKSGQTLFEVKIVADAKLSSMMPSKDVGLTSTASRRRRAVTPARPADSPAVPPAEELKHAPAKSSSEPAQEPVAPRAPKPDPPLPEKSRAIKRDAPAHDSPRVEDPEDPSIQASNMGVPAAEPRPRGSERSVGKIDPSAAPPDRKIQPSARRPDQMQERAPEPQAADFWAPPVPPANNPRPPAGEPPRVQAIPKLPMGGAKQPGTEEPLRADANPPKVAAKPPRVSEPPPGVAAHIAQKFGDGPIERGDGRPRGAAFSVMGWSFPAAPAEWQVQEGFGLQQSGHEDFPSSVAATEELLGGITLQQFVESQISMLRSYLRDPKIEPTMPPRVGGADESMAMDVRHSTKDGRELVYRRIYARSGSSVGVLTVTTLAADLSQVLQTLQPLLEGAAFRATPNN